MQRQRKPAEPDTGANFVTFRLEREGLCWHYRPTWLARLFPRAFTLGGYVAAVIGIVQMGESLLAGMAGIAIGALFVWLGRYLAVLFDNGPRFDTASRRIEVYEGLANALSLSPTARTQRIAFDTVRQLEMQSKTIRSTDSRDYENVELNLVLKDGSRIVLVSHPDGEQIASEAVTLGRVLDVPVADERQEETS